MKRTLLIGLAVVVILAAGGYFWAQSRYDAAVRAEVQRLADSVSAPCKATVGKVESDLLSQTIALYDVEAICSIQGGDQTFFVKRATLKGLQRKALEQGSGRVKLLDSLEMAEIAFAGPAVSGHIDAYLIGDISGDPGVLNSALAGAPATLVSIFEGVEALDRDAQRRAFADMAELFGAYETVSLGSVSVKNYAYDVSVEDQTLSVSLKDFQGSSHTIREFGPMRLTGLTVAVDGTPLAEADAVSLDGMKLPSLVPLFAELAKPTPPDMAVLETVFTSRDFALTHLRFTGLRVLDPDNPDQMAVILDNLSLNYAGESGHAVDLEYDLTLDRSLLAQDMAIPMAALFRLPDPLKVHSSLNLTAMPKGDWVYDVSWQAHTSEASLGAIRYAAEVTDFSLDDLARPNVRNLGIKSLSLSVTDTGISDVLFASAGAAQGAEPEAMRKMALAELVVNREMLPKGSLGNVLDDAVRFLQKPGKVFTVSAKPAAPIRIMQLQQVVLQDPERLGLTSSVSPVKP